MNTQQAANPSGAEPRRLHLGWRHWLGRLAMGALLFEIVSGLAITVSAFHAGIEWGVIAHTVLGALALLPFAWYCVRHISD